MLESGSEQSGNDARATGIPQVVGFSVTVLGDEQNERRSAVGEKLGFGGAVTGVSSLSLSCERRSWRGDIISRVEGGGGGGGGGGCGVGHVLTARWEVTR